MPELQPSLPSPGGLPPMAMEAASRAFDDSDVPLGCECADPALQIDRWHQEARVTPEPN
jgi:hypothetical protein